MSRMASACRTAALAALLLLVLFAASAAAAGGGGPPKPAPAAANATTTAAPAPVKPKAAQPHMTPGQEAGVIVGTVVGSAVVLGGLGLQDWMKKKKEAKAAAESSTGTSDKLVV